MQHPHNIHGNSSSLTTLVLHPWMLFKSNNKMKVFDKLTSALSNITRLAIFQFNLISLIWLFNCICVAVVCKLLRFEKEQAIMHAQKSIWTFYVGTVYIVQSIDIVFTIESIQKHQSLL